MGIIGMKVLCRGLGLQLPGYNSVEPWIRYALSHDVSTLVIGCETVNQVEQNVKAAIAATPRWPKNGLMEKAAARQAMDLMYYK
jgi:predicted aldo/keto reductase-like oxidoreductase